jgi:hypothetical protein
MNPSPELMSRIFSFLADNQAVPADIRGTNSLLERHLFKFTSAPQASVANQDRGKHTQAVLAEIAGEIAGHGLKVGVWFANIPSDPQILPFWTIARGS